jgi:uncharacterized membrane protein
MNSNIVKSLKANFWAGLVALLPLYLTIILLWNLFLLVDGILKGAVRLLLGNIIGWTYFRTHYIPGLGFITVILLILLAGLVARNIMGRNLVAIGNNIMAKIPLVNKIYKAIDQISQAFFSDKREVFQKAVIVEFPRKGVYAIAFYTQDTHGPVQDILPEDVISVFLPSTPNPTTGFLLFVPKKEVIHLDLSVEEALKLVISGGAIVPKTLSSNSITVSENIENPTLAVNENPGTDTHS